MKNIKVLAIAMLTAGLLLGCSKKDAKTAVQGVENLAKDNDLQGKFLGPCETSGLVGIQSRTALVFDGGKFKLAKAFFAEMDCSKDEVGSATYEGNFKNDEEKRPEGNVKTLEIAVEKAQIVIRSEALAVVASGANYCGVTSFELGKTYDVTPNTQQSNCFVTVVPTTFYGSYRITKTDAGMYLNLSATDVSKLATVKADRDYMVEPNQAAAYVKQH